MALENPMRYAHSEGHLDMCYDDTGKHILTCGPDGDVRIYKGFDDDDPVSYRVGDAAYAIAYKNDRFYVAADDYTVQTYMFQDGENDGVVARFTAPPTHLALNSTGTKIVSAASDFVVKLVELASSKQQVFEGHTAPVLSIALHPQQTLLASSSCDGFVIVWDVAKQTVLHKIAGLTKTNDFFSCKSLCRLTWNSDGKYLVVPIEKEVQVYDSSTWELAFSLTDSAITELVSIVTFSPCGNYLAAACRDGAIIIWNFHTHTCIAREKHGKSLTITALAWNPNGSNELAFCDNVGNLGVINIVIADSDRQTDPVAKDSLADLFDDSNDDLLEQASTAPPVVDDDDDDDENMVAIVKLKKQMSQILGDDDDNSRDTEYSEKTDTPAPVVTTETVLPPTRPQQEAPLVQPAFQPGSTPAHLSHRFMVWNSVGVVIQYNTEEENSINVEFHNTATHHAMHINNSLAHSMADLSTDAVLLACEADSQTPSKLVCMHFGSWDNCKEWTVSMPDGEDIKAICIGQGWVAVATDRRCVRLFSITGVQREIFSIPGPVVAMAAFDNQLFIVYHSAAGLPGEQCLGVHLMQIGRKHRAASVMNRLPLSHKATLVWIGFSAEGTPFSVDSQGIARMLNRGVSNCWTPVANLKKHCKGKLDNYWVVGIHENPQQLRAIHCKGSRYPATLPRPNVTLLPFQLPVCELDTDKGSLEETYLRSKLFSEHLSWWTSQGYECDESAQAAVLMPQQESLMKLFALSCKLGREARAEEVCQLMRGPHAVQLAIKYASRVHLLGLAERLSDIARRQAEEQEQVSEEEMDAEEEDGYDIRRSHCNGGDNSQSNGHIEEMVGEEEDPIDVAEEEEAEETRNSGPMLNLKPKKIKVPKPKYILHSQDEKKNPFKLQSQIRSTSVKGSRVFDTVERSKANTKLGSNKNTTSGVGKSNKLGTIKVQPKLFKGKTTAKKATQLPDSPECTDNNTDNGSGSASTKSGMTAFQLWLSAHREELQEECPELSETDLTVVAARRYKELSADEKQEWQTRATQSENIPTKKRKLEAEDCGENKSAKKDSNGSDNKTSRKLANFAFAR